MSDATDNRFYREPEHPTSNEQLYEWLNEHRYLLTAKALEGIWNILGRATHEPCDLPDLEGEHFYNLMQTYRCMPTQHQDMVIEAFEAVKTYLRSAQPPSLPLCQYNGPCDYKLDTGLTKSEGYSQAYAGQMRDALCKILVRTNDNVAKSIAGEALLPVPFKPP